MNNTAVSADYIKTADEKILELKNVSLIFNEYGKKFAALDDVSFYLKSSEVLGIIGESGSGKSSIAKVITGLNKPSSGSIFYMGEDITRLKKEQKHRLYRHVQMVFQNAPASFNPRRKIGKSIEEIICRLCANAQGSVRQKAEKLIMEVGLDKEYLNRYPHEISGGQCQRAAIARAMAVSPRVLICDESTSALDVSVQAVIIDLLLKLRREKNMSLIFISHDLALVSSITDRLIIMDSGKIVESGNTCDVVSNPQSQYTKRLLDAVL
ncbi:hypothetical protein HMPREF9333_01543 [Johnsonella ignava ATCC 51276]|uniref:ABC transporter domain-containing protein n=1 Tax=Johnsonella ignava ATCC 51276 TaxID=679200 RepID=G5GJ03_9FIRM|nr:dipeptide/oligopeptide/nickel ABC transporter ATP-binding protein [Johnsonella ignava]EHI55407.1 hypothetical protein HMPREF9333_01543 [Johnsonella ignava ATCC 51276]